jgi:hypothetical protein
MKTILALVAALSVSIALPVLAEEDNSLLEKGVKLKVYEESDDDSTLKKAAGLKATGEVLDDEEDPAVKKATKLKVLKEASE